ncbi:MAG: SEL1-like repeat protein [Geothrix sp.]|uniref:energy transducer TonB n=1 Tax=Geothrix sp. TaxID=1962974 RepID=UPI0017AE3ADA|nr:energy transducer TonB [Geothrix sp.]NWJ40602.1 SEL1-like repeat protein [Geothrix sp.]WIL21394.1 MAG: energy transducer TonB [Geothrix sp.]
MTIRLLVPILACSMAVAGEPPATIPGADAFVKAVTTLAEQGQAQAQYILGMMHEDAICFPKSYPEAFRWLKKAADQGHAEAQCEVGLLYGNGHGVSADQVSSVRYFRLAADQGHVRSMRYLALKYARGLGTKRDDAESHNLTARAAEAGDMASQLILGDWYTKGGIVPDYSKALTWYTAAADQGLPTAMFRLGTCLEQGMGTEADPVQALTWFRKAADGHEPDALLRLSSLMASGEIQPKDPSLIAKWRGESELQAGRPSAGTPGGVIGGVVGGPSGGPASAPFSQKKEAAEAGDPEAQVALGTIYEQGRLVRRNLTEAMKWYLAAARQGHVPACYLAGRSYERGMGTKADLKEALAWFQKGAQQQDADCMLHLAFMHDHGVGLAKDPAKAAAWRSQVPLPPLPETRAPGWRDERAPGGVPGGMPALPAGMANGLDQADGRPKIVDFDFSQIRIRYQPPAPPYPPLAKIAKIQGTVVVEIVVGPDGVPDGTHAVEGPPQLKSCAEEYASRWRFMPALLNGTSVYARFRLTMPFRLREL